ncbi:MAG: undecaprenyl/decaprenyl-phosphate alpha-N-acetylglucosaminyl 1-phosphate transferase [Nitrospiraceae bacterium]|nr:MAG: undecaprenyl/decaprenyl-phosphate alpha-N-acetylglucosaminyl 1-phosphate transferase [Nitrospiraceae bacterium]
MQALSFITGSVALTNDVAIPVYGLFIFAFVISYALVPLVTEIAYSSGAVALPGKRHIHTHPTPKFGGIAIASGILLVSCFISPFDKTIWSYIISSILMLILGIIDDIRTAHWKLKLGFSLVATSIIIFGAGIWVKSLGDLFGLGEIYLGIFGIPFTYVAVFGVVNAINLIDGLNGLACGISSIAFATFAAFALVNGNETVFYLSVINLGGTLGLFRYNYPRAKIFMGDSGSLFLGFSLAVHAIMLTQGNGTVDPMVPVIILGIPIFDTIRVMMLRIWRNKHPFLADKTHMHHLMIRSGIAPGRVVKTYWLFSALLSLLAFALYTLNSWVMFLVLCILMSFVGVFIENLRIIKLSAARK